jgi:hypothetical protein
MGLTLFFGVETLATEPDQFTQKSVKIRDIGREVDLFINKQLDLAADNVTKPCDKESLYTNLVEIFDEGEFHPSIEIGINRLIKKEKLPHKVFDDTKKSVYRDNPFTIVGAIGECGVCSDSINVYGIELGIDKIGHFFSEGFDYYAATELIPNGLLIRNPNALKILDKFNRLDCSFKLQGDKVQFVKKLGDCQEKGTWGQKYNFIYSYGDLVANWEGYQFWQNLTEGPNPYFVCDNNRWKKAKVFTFRDYLNHGFDESINCSQFSAIAEKDNKRNISAALKAQKFKSTSCPVYPQLCTELINHYGDQAQGLIHPDCLAAGSDVNKSNSRGRSTEILQKASTIHQK